MHVSFFLSLVGQIAVSLAAPIGQGRCPFSRPESRRYASRFLPRDLGIACLPVASDHEQQQLLQSRLVAGSILAGSKDGRRPGRDGTTPQRQPAQNSEQVSDERVTNGLHMMQDHLQQTTVISHRRSQKTLTEQAASRTKGNAAYEATDGGCYPSTRTSRRSEACLRAKIARMPQNARRLSTTP